MKEVGLILNELFSLHRFGIKPGLDRISYLLNTIDNPQNKFISIHIAGTKGKGSVAAMLASVLQESGYRTGLYTSPHLLKFNERIRINGKMISDEEIASSVERLIHNGKAVDSTFFEITTALAFDYFYKSEVEIAIIETGMGGRFDSTNVINPILSIITSIGLDHQEYLGNTIELIAKEKSGIIKYNTDVIISDSNNELRSIFQNCADSNKSKIIFTNDHKRVEHRRVNQELASDYSINYMGEAIDIALPLPGEHQKANLEAVIIASELIQSRFRVTVQSLTSGLQNVIHNTGFIGRIQKIRESPILIIDTSHNEISVAALIDTLKTWNPEKKYAFVFGIMSDKNISEILRLFEPYCSTLILTQPATERSADIHLLESIALEAGFQNVKLIPQCNEALNFAFRNNEDLVITGSFYLIGEILPTLKAKFPEKFNKFDV